jgi:small subunit ribosomal protein S14
MAKVGSIEIQKKRERLVRKYAARREALLQVARDRSLTIEERFKAHLALAKLPRNGSKTRLRNRCGLTGRPRGYYRKFRMSRIALRELASAGLIPGVVKSSW